MASTLRQDVPLVPQVGDLGVSRPLGLAAVVAGVHRCDEFEVFGALDGPDDLGPHPSAGSENGYLHGSS